MDFVGLLWQWLVCALPQTPAQGLFLWPCFVLSERLKNTPFCVLFPSHTINTNYLELLGHEHAMDAEHTTPV